MLSQLCRLSLSHTNFRLLGYKSATDFGTDLARMRRMRSLDLAGALKTDDVVHVVGALCAAKHLQHLNIADAHVSGPAASSKLRGLVAALPTSLRSLDISLHTPPPRPKLTPRNSFNGNNNNMINAINNALAAGALPAPAIGAIANPDLAAANGNAAVSWPTALTSLVISGRGCVLSSKDAPAEVLVDSLRALRKLRRLDLTTAAVVGPVRIGLLASVLSSMPDLEHLDLGPSHGVDESDSITERLALSIADLTALTTLRMELSWLTAAQLGVAVAPLRKLRCLALSNVRPRDLAPLGGSSIWEPPAAAPLVQALHESGAQLTHLELDDYRAFARVIYQEVRSCSLSSVLLETSALQSISLSGCGMDGDAVALVAAGVASGSTPALRSIRLCAAGPVALLPFLYFLYVMQFDETVEVNEWVVGPTRSQVSLFGRSANLVEVELTDLMLQRDRLVNY